MGAWSHEPFGNDTACDWAYELENQSDLGYIEATIDRALSEGEEYLEAPEGEEGIAAVEVIAQALGKGTQNDSYTESTLEWVLKVKPVITDELRAKALKFLEVVASENSELLELWCEDGDDSPWLATIESLKTAVSI
ncbi:DUF4259 domain-containing protein [Pleionea litopenaei]|uniref:DUF4259 domain-containing protein n=1 Tax=Pleionea litopenaei TaxID=3070815 RepID=A0AA51RTP3_9GAMM|nr:DUF4259 domain-containing protein [Pleionea sp. HL-JVS1]WMS87390.1 DUF4259 domain-containing protein [Pleionea sp. HL-JVS1]